MIKAFRLVKVERKKGMYRYLFFACNGKGRIHMVNPSVGKGAIVEMQLPFRLEGAVGDVFLMQFERRGGVDGKKINFGNKEE